MPRTSQFGLRGGIHSRLAWQGRGNVAEYKVTRGFSTYLAEKSSKAFSCPASPSARRTASWKFFNEYRTIAGCVSVPFDNIVRRLLVAARTSASGWEGT